MVFPNPSTYLSLTSATHSQTTSHYPDLCPDYCNYLLTELPATAFAPFNIFSTQEPEQLLKRNTDDDTSLLKTLHSSSSSPWKLKAKSLKWLTRL